MTDRARIGKYQLVELIGRGGMGEVWRARDTELDRTVAIKRLQRADGEDLLRFRREAVLTARLNHPNIAQVYEFGEDYLAMQFIDGRPIGELQGLRENVRALVDASRAVHYAHQSGVLHRDLKPDNILIDAAGHAFVLDFGLAREVRTEHTSVSLTGDILGTPSYMAPEQARGAVRSVDARTDVWGLGATLYALLAGRPPHTGPTAYEVIRRVIEEDPAPPGGDGDLQIVSLKALHHDPARRYQTAAEFADDLERWRRREPIRARPPSWAYRLGRRIQRQPLAWTLSAALVAALVGGASFGLHYLLESRASLQLLLEASRERERAARAQALVDEARARLADVRTATYVRGCSLEPYFESLAAAREACLSALALKPGHADASYWLAEACAMEGDYSRAVSVLENAARGGAPGYVLARLGRAYLEEAWVRILVADSAEEESRIMAEAAANAAACFERAGEDVAGIDRVVADAWGMLARKQFAALDEVASRCTDLFGTRPGVEEILFAAAIGASGPQRIERATRALEIRPGHFAALHLRAATWKEQGDSARARADLEEAVRLHPRFAAGWISLGLLYFELGDAAASIDCGTRALELWPRSAVAFLNCGNARLLSGDPEGARADLARAMELAPAWPNPWVARGSLRFQEGDFEGAEADSAEAIRLDPSCGDAWINRGVARYSRGDLKGALGDLDEGLVLKEGDWNGHVVRAIVREALGNPEGAEADYEAAIRIDPRQPIIFHNRAALWADRGDSARAIVDMTRALQLDPERWESYFERGHLRSRSHDPAGAIADFDEAIRRRPNHAPAYLERGKCRLATGDAEGAVADETEAIRLKPDIAGSYFERGNAYQAMGDYTRAVQDFTAALERRSDYFHAYVNRATSHRMLRDPESAIRDCDRALELRPGTAEPLATRGLARYETKDYAGAVEDLAESLRAAPADWTLRESIRGILEEARRRAGEFRR